MPMVMKQNGRGTEYFTLDNLYDLRVPCAVVRTMRAARRRT